MSRLKEMYKDEIVDAMIKKFGYENLSVASIKSLLNELAVDSEIHIENAAFEKNMEYVNFRNGVLDINTGKLANQKLHESKIEAAKENIGKKDEEEKLNKIESIGVKLIEKCVSFKKEDNNIEYETDPFYTIEENDKIY